MWQKSTLVDKFKNTTLDLIKNFPNRDDGYFALSHGDNLAFFGFGYPYVSRYFNGVDYKVELKNLAVRAMSENSEKITKDCYFEFCCGKFEFINNIPDWAKDIYEE